MDTVQDTYPTTKRIPGVEYDENGKPVWYTTEEIFDELDQKLITHYGEEYRQLANERRVRWNKKSSWHFEPL
jgi:hypothetical protein